MLAQCHDFRIKRVKDGRAERKRIGLLLKEEEEERKKERERERERDAFLKVSQLPKSFLEMQCDSPCFVHLSHVCLFFIDICTYM